MIHIHRVSDADRGKEEGFFITIVCHVLMDIGVPESAAIAAAACLCSQMSPTHLHYHTFAHPNEMFQFIAQKKLQLTAAEKLAILYHDAVYIPGQTPASEMASAEFMKAQINWFPGVKTEVVADAYKIIQDTARHLTGAEHEISHLVMDLDVHTMAANEQVFRKNNDLLQLEIGLNNTDKRKAFLKLFLQKPKIFYKLTDLEAPARKNLEAEIQKLGG